MVIAFLGGDTLTTNEYPRLCGGTFFTLLLQARPQRIKPREHRKGERDGLSDTDTLIGLLKVFDPDYIEPTGTTKDTFKTNTSDFKSCKISSSVYIPIKNTTAFDNRVKSDYLNPLRAMSDFVANFIDVGMHSEKDKRLVRALIELIGEDQSINKEQVFYVCEDGTPIEKSILCQTNAICLQPFLLGIWHYVLVNGKKNTIGKATYDIWCPPNNRSEREYKGNMGDGVTHAITLIYFADAAKAYEFAKDTDEQACDVDTEENAQSSDASSATSDTTQPKTLVDIFEDAIDKFHVAEFVDADFTAMPLYYDTVCDIDDFVATIRDALRSFRRKQDSTYRNVIDFINTIDRYSLYMGTKMLCDDGRHCRWLPKIDWKEIHEVTMEYRRHLDRIYGLLSNGGTLSVFGYAKPNETESSGYQEDADPSIDGDWQTGNAGTDSTSKTASQVVNNPIVFNQYGENNTQIGFVETLTIDKRGKEKS